MKWLLPEILPDSGYIMLAGAPKDGKSYFCTQLISSLLTGGTMFGNTLNKLDPKSILYFDLENSKRTRQTRLKQFFPFGLMGTEFGYITEAYPILGSPNFIEQLEEYRKELPNLKLVIIDMYKHIQSPRQSTETQNQHESKELKALGDYFKDSGLLALLVNHTVKDNTNNSDPFQMAMGTAGSLGAFDQLIVITKEHDPYTKNVTKRQIHVKGRDVEEKHFDAEFINGYWSILGDSETVQEENLKNDYMKNTTLKAIIELVKDNNGKWIGSSTDIKRKIAEIERVPFNALSRTPHSIAKEIENELKEPLLNIFGIKYNLIDNKGSAKKHQFYKVGILEDEDFIEITKQEEFI